MKVGWMREKSKAAVVLKGLSPIVKQATKIDMDRRFFRHINKAIAKTHTPRDAKHWKRMLKFFKKKHAERRSEQRNNCSLELA